MAVKAIPDGYYSLTPYLVCKDAAKAIEFYTKAFGAQEVVRMPGPGGRIMHAEVKIGNSMLMLSDENPERGAVAPSGSGRSSSLMFYTDDVDTVFRRALDYGATSIETPWNATNPSTLATCRNFSQGYSESPSISRRSTVPLLGVGAPPPGASATRRSGPKRRACRTSA